MHSLKIAQAQGWPEYRERLSKLFAERTGEGERVVGGTGNRE
jgi:hypothetical protein